MKPAAKKPAARDKTEAKFPDAKPAAKRGLPPAFLARQKGKRK